MARSDTQANESAARVDLKKGYVFIEGIVEDGRCGRCWPGKSTNGDAKRLLFFEPGRTPVTLTNQPYFTSTRLASGGRRQYSEEMAKALVTRAGQPFRYWLIRGAISRRFISCKEKAFPKAYQLCVRQNARWPDMRLMTAPARSLKDHDRTTGFLLPRWRHVFKKPAGAYTMRGYSGRDINNHTPNLAPPVTHR